MKNFFEHLAPFAPDYSGAAAVFYGAGGMVVICDPGGCSGNVCGYDEPRFYRDRGMIFSAALRDMDTIFGRDSELVDKICRAAEGRSIPFIALVGTPVISVIATDLNAVCSMVEKRSGIRTVSADTNGMDLYDKGERKARKVIERYLPELADRLGPTPLDDIPEEAELERLVREVGKAAGTENKAAEAEERKAGSRILIVHSQQCANMLRERLWKEGYGNVTVGTWFQLDPGQAREQDLQFKDEAVFAETVSEYDCFIGDPLFYDALGDYRGAKIAFPHLAVSGDLYGSKW